MDFETKKQLEDASSLSPASIGVTGAMGRDGAVRSIHNAAYMAGRLSPMNIMGTEEYVPIWSITGPNQRVWENTTLQAEGPPRPGYSGAKGPMAPWLGDHTPNFPMDEASPLFSDMLNLKSGQQYPLLRGNQGSSPVATMTGFHPAKPLLETSLYRGIDAAGMENAVNSNESLLSKMVGEPAGQLRSQVGKGAVDAGANVIRIRGGESALVAPPPSARNILRPEFTTDLHYAGNQGSDPAGRPFLHNIQTDHGGSPWQPTLKNPYGEYAPKPRGPLEIAPGQGGRAGSAGMGAAGAGLTALGIDLYRRYKGENVSIADTAANVATGTGMGAAGGVATDRLALALGGGARAMKGAGGVVGAILSGGASAWEHGKHADEANFNASQATADVLVDTGIGFGSGLAGMAAGAAIGSIVPIAGTAIGAGLGFLGGMGVGMFTHWAANKSGVSDWAKKGLGNALSGGEAGLSTLWKGAASAGHGVAQGAKGLYHWLAD